MKSIHPYILIVSVLVLPILPFLWEQWEHNSPKAPRAPGAGLLAGAHISRDLQPRDGRYLLTWTWLVFNLVIPRRILSLGLTTNGWETTEDPNGQNDHRGAKIT
ncbi:hypothetical protein BM1_10993 [Bipolaris maydis]|nr:hypothetical protein BM1_10993 [Bipolaris maydis]